MRWWNICALPSSIDYQGIGDSGGLQLGYVGPQIIVELLSKPS